MSFTIFQNEKNAFLGYKNNKFKKSKNCGFCKGVNPWFLSKNGHFSNFFFQAIQNRKMFFTIFQNQKTPFQAIKTRSSKSRKIDIFPKGLTHGFCPKMVIFPTFFFRQYRTGKCLSRCSRTKNRHFSNFIVQAIQAKKLSFTILQNEKTPFQAIKTRSSKSRKIDIFPKGLTHGFCPKMAIFPTFFLAIIGQEYVFYDILERKNPFLAYKNKKFKKSKN